MSRNSLHRYRALLIATLGASCVAPAWSSITYSLEPAHAAAGETIAVKAVLFNDTDSVLDFTAPKNLVLQWRDPQGKAVRSLAYLAAGQQPANVPVNNFVKYAWRAVVPSGVRGLQAVSIEGSPTLLALDATPLEKSPITGTSAAVPVIDAGAGQGTPEGDPALPAAVVTATGASAAAGPAVSAAARSGATTPSSAFENFRSAISPHDPVYFDLGNKDGANARLQVSFKYRLFTPTDAENPHFLDHLYLGYTQTALWDLAGRSKPFIDTTYNPSLFWRKDKMWESAGQRWSAGLATGVEHKSNGKDGADSRSLNNAFVQPELNYRFDGGSTLTFAPRVKQYFKMGQNDDYASYAGYVDWNLRWAQDNGLVLAGLYRQGHHGRYTAQVEAAWPLRRTFLNMNGYLHVQFFKGYGETLLGYNHKSEPQVRLGLSLVP